MENIDKKIVLSAALGVALMGAAVWAMKRAATAVPAAAKPLNTVTSVVSGE